MNLYFELTPAFFANISFLLLFLAMTVYWIDLAFFKRAEDYNSGQQSVPVQPSATYNKANVLAYDSVGSVQVSVNTKLNKSFLEKMAKFFVISSNLSLVLLLCIRWKESGHFPLSNLYESLMFLSWSCTGIHLFLLYTNGTTQAPTAPTNSNNVFMEKLLGAVLAPCALFLNAFATFSLPNEMQQAGPLVPALQSNWLMMHVTVMIVSYAALILGSLLSIAFLIYGFAKGVFANLQVTGQSQAVLKSKIASNLDYLSYRIIGIGFPFLTIGILSGAVWANEAWGSYWSWDPKETWALLTWLVFAIYLHTRFTKGWEGFKPALIAAFGFIVVWVCYLGVNLLGKGLHSYGWFSS